MDLPEHKNEHENENETVDDANVKEIKDKFLNIDSDVNWETLLPIDDDLADKLLIITELAQQPDIDDLDKFKTYLDWTDLFFKCKGFQHLMKIFEGYRCNNDADENNCLLKILIPLINSFLRDAISCESSMNDIINNIYNIYPNNDAFLKDFNEDVIKRSGMIQPVEKGDIPDWICEEEKTDQHKKWDKMSKNIKQKYAESIINSVDCRKILIKLLELFMSQNDNLMMRYSTNLWILLVLYKPDLLPDLFQFIQNNTSFIIKTIQSTDEKIQFEFVTSIFRLCAVIKTPYFKQQPVLCDEIIGFLLKNILLNDLPKCSTENNKYLASYLKLLGILLYEYTKYNHNMTEFPELFEHVFNELKLYKSQETFHSNEEDGILCGLLAILLLLLLNNKYYRQQCVKFGFIEELWNNFIFSINIPKCKHNKSKSIAFKIIIECILDCPDMIAMIMKKIQTFQNEFKICKPIYTCDYEPVKSMRSSTNYVGLKNLGSTDYMNCMFQQFYMMPTFRNNLICAGIDITNKLPNDGQYSDCILYQIMKMFSFLSLSTRQGYDTISFCKSWKDDKGIPVDIRVHQDVHEFFNIFTERVGIELQSTKYSDLLKDTFGCEIITQMICQGGCNNIREQKQYCMAIPITIINKNNLQESLISSYVETEQLQGVQCDKCQSKCDTLRREVIGRLPNTILFQLKRFDLNYETFQQTKIYNRFEFPKEIELEKFTIINDDNKINDDEYYKYELYGIIIHSGNEENGHYYSYIRDYKNDKWIEFNDNLVKPFDINNISDAAFGGINPINNEEKMSSAYGLIYQRKQIIKQQEQKIDNQSSKTLQLICNNMPKLEKEIFDNNTSLMRDIQLYSIPYFEFIYNLICISPKYEMKQDEKNDTLNITKNATLMCLKYLSKTSGKNDIFKKFIHYLKLLYTDNVSICLWFLQYLSKEPTFETYILTTRDMIVRPCVSDLIVHTLKQFKFKDNDNAINNSTINAFFDRMIKLIDIAPKHWFRFGDFFRIFYEFSLMGSAQRNCLIDKKLIQILGDLLLGSRSPYASKEKQYQQMGSRMYPPKFDVVIQTISILIRSCHTPQSTKCSKYYESKHNEMTKVEKNILLGVSCIALSYKDPINNPDMPNRNCLHILGKEDEKLPHSRFLYDKLIAEAHHSETISHALNNMIVHWSYCDKLYSEEICKIILEGIDKSGADQVKTYLTMMHDFIKIEDDQREYRLKLIHSPNDEQKGIFYYIYCYRLQHRPFTFQCIKGITKIMNEYKPYLMYMITLRDDWFWWDEWLQKYVESAPFIDYSYGNTYQYDYGQYETLKDERIAWYKEQYSDVLQKYCEYLVYGFVTDLVKRIGFEKNIPIDIIPEFVKFFW